MSPLSLLYFVYIGNDQEFLIRGKELLVQHSLGQEFKQISGRSTGLMPLLY